MTRRTLVGVVVLLLVTMAPASAQIAVIDPANLAEAILIVQRTQRQLEELREQYRTIVRMAQGLGRMDQYRTPPFALSQHDPGRWAYGRPWITALNSGDATGAAYLSTAYPLAARSERLVFTCFIGFGKRAATSPWMRPCRPCSRTRSRADEAM